MTKKLAKQTFVLVAVLATTALACSDDDTSDTAPTTSAPTTTVEEPSSSTSTPSPTDGSPTSATPTTEAPGGGGADGRSPEDVAIAVADAWTRGDDAALRADAEQGPADLLGALDAGDVEWEPGGCEGAAGSTYCSFVGNVTTLTLRVANEARVVAGASLTSSGDAVALWPLTTAEEAENTQAEVDDGSSPWQLEPTAVAASYADAELGLRDARVGDFDPATSTVQVTGAGDRAVVLTLTQPAREGTGGIWSVTAVESLG